MVCWRVSLTAFWRSQGANNKVVAVDLVLLRRRHLWIIEPGTSGAGVIFPNNIHITEFFKKISRDRRTRPQEGAY